MQWKRDPKVSVTDMCIFIDEHMAEIKVPKQNPELEDRIYNYLWLIVKAIAIKKRMFNNFEDYDNYAFYAAKRLFFAIRKNLQNDGKIIKGKKIRPIKSIKNYTNLLLYPMKIEFQNESFAEVISEEYVSKKFDSMSFQEKLREDARATAGVTTQFLSNMKDALNNCDELLDKVLQKSPFRPNSLEYKYLKITIILNCLNILKTKNKLTDSINTVILWKLPKTLSSYVRVLLKEFFKELKTEILDCYEDANYNDETMDSMILMSNPNWEQIKNEN